MEILWANTDDGERMFVDFDGRAQDMRVAAELVTPERIAQHNIGRRVRAAFIVEVEEPSQLRAEAEHAKVVPGNLVKPALSRNPLDAKSCVVELVCGHVAEGVVAAAKIEIVRVRLTIVAMLLVHHAEKPVGIRDVDGVEYERIQHPKNNDVSADAEGEGQYGRERKCRTPEGAANRVADIACYAIQYQCCVSTGYSLFHHCPAAKAKHRVTVRLFLGHSGCDVVLTRISICDLSSASI